MVVNISTIIKNWPGREDLHIIQTLTKAELEACDTAEFIFNVFGKKSSPNIMKQFCPFKIVN